jgi:hypothetical protein
LHRHAHARARTRTHAHSHTHMLTVTRTQTSSDYVTHGPKYTSIPPHAARTHVTVRMNTCESVQSVISAFHIQGRSYLIVTTDCGKNCVVPATQLRQVVLPFAITFNDAEVVWRGWCFRTTVDVSVRIRLDGVRSADQIIWYAVRELPLCSTSPISTKKSTASHALTSRRAV